MSWLNIFKWLTWFLEALIQTKWVNPSITDKSDIVFVFKSKYRISLYLRMIGNNRSIYFSAMDRRLYAKDRLLAVFPSPDKAPLSTSYNFLRSYYAFTLASSSSFLRSYYLSLSYYNFCFIYYCSCSSVFCGGGCSCTSSDIF